MGHRRSGGRRRRLARGGRFTFLGYVYVLDDYGVLGGMVDPFAEFVDVGVGVNGFDQGGRGDFHILGAFDDGFERGANGFSAASKDSGGMNVAIDGGVVGNFVVLSDAVRAAPAEEFLFDVFAVRMTADIATTRMRTHFCACSRYGRAARSRLLRLFGIVGHLRASNAFRLAGAVDIDFCGTWAVVK